VSEDVAIAQIVTAITTVFYAAVFAIGYYLMIKGNRKTLREMRQERLSGGRPQVVIEASLLNLPMVELVVRNESGGAAKDITFDLSARIEDSSGFVLSDLRYLKEGGYPHPWGRREDPLRLGPHRSPRALSHREGASRRYNG
jgi:hypothetical protein